MTVQPQLSLHDLTHFNNLTAQANQHFGNGDQDRFLNTCSEAVDYLTDLFQKSKVNSFRTDCKTRVGDFFSDVVTKAINDTSDKAAQMLGELINKNDYLGVDKKLAETFTFLTRLESRFYQLNSAKPTMGHIAKQMCRLRELKTQAVNKKLAEHLSLMAQRYQQIGRLIEQGSYHAASDTCSETIEKLHQELQALPNDRGAAFLTELTTRDIQQVSSLKKHLEKLLPYIQQLNSHHAIALDHYEAGEYTLCIQACNDGVKTPQITINDAWLMQFVKAQKEIVTLSQAASLKIQANTFKEAMFMNWLESEDLLRQGNTSMWLKIAYDTLDAIAVKVTAVEEYVYYPALSEFIYAIAEPWIYEMKTIHEQDLQPNFDEAQKLFENSQYQECIVLCQSIQEDYAVDNWTKNHEAKSALFPPIAQLYREIAAPYIELAKQALHAINKQACTQDPDEKQNVRHGCEADFRFDFNSTVTFYRASSTQACSNENIKAISDANSIKGILKTS
jgi:hypothetical protein